MEGLKRDLIINTQNLKMGKILNVEQINLLTVPTTKCMV